MIESIPAEHAARLRAAGLRVTGPRLAILQALGEDHRHPTAENVHEALRRRHPSLSLSTVYQTLQSFLAAGLIRRAPGRGGLRVDGTADDHDHAICRDCGEVFDVDRRHFKLPDPPVRLPDGLEVAAVRIEYDVRCTSCSARAKPTTRRRP